MVSTQYRNVCFTVNNPVDDLDPSEWPDVRYCVWQKEVGEAGTPHFQGYVEFTKKKTITAMKRMAGLERAHFEKRMGTASQAAEYCQKEEGRLEGPWEYGQAASETQGENS